MAETIIANDIGTTQVKSICVYKSRLGKHNRVTLPTVLGETKNWDGNSQPKNLMQITTEEGKWLVGDSAQQHSKYPIWGRDDDWLMGPHYKALHLFSISQHIGSTTRAVEVDLVAGLPRIDYKKRGEVSTNLLGSHAIELEDRGRLTININNIYFAIQGWAAIMAEGFKRGHGVAWLGLGGRNKTYATIDRYGDIMPDQTGSDEVGFLSVIDDLIARIKNEFYIELTGQEAIEVFRTERIQKGKQIIDVSGMVDEITGYYIDGTNTLISTIWHKQKIMPKIEDFRLGGGGAIPVGQAIAAKYDQARVVNEPVWSEALGLINLGIVRFANGSS